MKYLITGGAGFIGSHIVEYLLKEDNDVVVLDDLSTGNMDNLAPVRNHSRLHTVEAEVLNETVMDRLVSECDRIIHLAAAVGVRLIIEDPIHTITINVQGTEMALKLARRHARPVFIASTSEVYGKGLHIPFVEEADIVLGPTSKNRWSYACSKALDEFLALAYVRQFGVQAFIARFFNTIGPRQTGHYGMVVPRFVRQALRGKPITVYGDGNQTRCFCNVLDVAPAVIEMMDTEETVGEVINLGNDEEVTINALAERILGIVGGPSSIVHVPYEEAYQPGFEDMERRVPSIEKARRLIGFEPKLSLDDTLAQIVEFERSRLHQEEDV
ncbi:MAG: NAD-dependent epimerase/dehydratase family protein [Armatimonadetes bacterium]|nr:NAD-dependent epimerase/dehydratase family protein [Armatimonadota bacterium]PIY44018.1 MAG: nucleoside-diphosphate sugar epimerase [Armatimonadetes bacterium CG_4_10_14_3_um_filter_59_10]PJB69573.1 MAG: nucleoside-diphosphate sugar epimerase [Armatimonadetes bacterium CG_4_9_14_3_um_filter_58_7]